MRCQSLTNASRTRPIQTATQLAERKVRLQESFRCVGVSGWKKSQSQARPIRQRLRIQPSSLAPDFWLGWQLVISRRFPRARFSSKIEKQRTGA